MAERCPVCRRPILPGELCYTAYREPGTPRLAVCRAHADCWKGCQWAEDEQKLWDTRLILRFLAPSVKRQDVRIGVRAIDAWEAVCRQLGASEKLQDDILGGT